MNMNNGQLQRWREEEEGRGGTTALDTAIGAASRNAHGWVIGGASGYPGNTMISVLATLFIFSTFLVGLTRRSCGSFFCAVT
jgi:hypothetical protein